MIVEANLHWAYLDTETKLIMPWLTLPTLQWLKTMDISQWSVFEYGAGYSTAWFRANCKEVDSIDSEYTWALAMNVKAAFNERAYIEARGLIGPAHSHSDCIVVDGIHREMCVAFSIDYLKSGGFLIIDNWDQEDFPHDAVERTLDLLKDWNREIHAQPNHRTWKTAVFRKP